MISGAPRPILRKGGCNPLETKGLRMERNISSVTGWPIAVTGWPITVA